MAGDGALDGRTCLVTGGASGIGRATVAAMAEAGAGGVAVLDRDQVRGAALVEQLDQAGCETVLIPCDVSQPRQVADAIADVVDRFGGLDVAFNNAGLFQPWAPVHEITDEVWDRTLAVNLSGVFYAMRAELATMVEQGHGVIVNCSSVAGVSGFPQAGAYAATKHGILGLTRSAASEVAELGVRVNAVCPGPVDTPLLKQAFEGDDQGLERMASEQPMGRLVEPAEVAEAVVWLASKRASGINGVALPVDQGLGSA